MKLASLKDGSRDGQLVVVSRDLSSAHFASGIAGRLQQVLDDWNFLSPQLEELSRLLNQGRARHAFAFDPSLCLAPLPRARLWAEAPSAPVLAERLGLAPQPLLSLVRCDALLAASDPPPSTAADEGLDFGPMLVAATGDVPAGAPPEQALDGVRLLLLANAWRLHGEGLDAMDTRPATTFAPVAITPDELGDGWREGCVHGSLSLQRDGRRFGLLDTGEGARPFGPLLAHLARRHALAPGSLVAAGLPGTADSARGSACIAERRALEAAAGGSPRTPWFGAGEALHIEWKGLDGRSAFGAIDLRAAAPAAEPSAEAR